MSLAYCRLFLLPLQQQFLERPCGLGCSLPDLSLPCPGPREERHQLGEVGRATVPWGQPPTE